MARNVRVLIFALLCVLAVSVAAATLTNPTQEKSGSGGGLSPFQGDTTTDKPSADSGGQNGTKSPRTFSQFSLKAGCFPVLMSPGFILGALVLVLLVFWVLQRRENWVFALAVVFPLLTFLTPIWFVLTDCSTRKMPQYDGGLGKLREQAESVNVGGEAAETAQQFLPPVVLLGLLLVVAAVLAYLTLRASDDDTAVETDEEEPTDEAAEDEAMLSAVGAAAGEAADRIEAPEDVDNEVYRAWREMTDLLDVPNPDASTPAEFADAAADAGMDAEHVDRLTDLFRDVRYGGRSATADRERDAVEALRAIEATYAGGEP